MDDVENNNGEAEEPRWNPQPFLIAGLTATGLAWVLSWLMEETGTTARVLLLLFGLLAGAVAARVGYRSWRILLGCAGTAFLAFLAMDDDWDTVQLVAVVLTAAALVGSGLAALPPSNRRVAVSGIIVLHFLALLVAVTLQAPPGTDSPWLSNQLWSRFFNPYLDLLHLNNAYNFYSPDPGPETLLWFRVEFADGSARWMTLSRRQAARTALEFVRLVSLAEAAGHFEKTLPDDWDAVLEERKAAGMEYDPPMPLDEGNLDNEYQEPSRQAKRLFASYARHLAHILADPDDPARAIVGIKIYRVVHANLNVADFNDGKDPADPTFFWAYYQGEYDAEGQLKPESFRVEEDENGAEREVRDPLLYWRLPIVREEDGSLTNYVDWHAGATDEGEDRGK